MYRLLLACLLVLFTGADKRVTFGAWIRINQLGYTPDGLKIAVLGSKDEIKVDSWQLVDAETKKVVASGKAGKAFGAYGPFVQTYRLNFSAYKKPGRYYLQAKGITSLEFEIGVDVYKGAADFCTSSFGGVRHTETELC